MENPIKTSNQFSQNSHENKLWQKRSKIFLVFIGFTVYWLLTLTIPYFMLAGSGEKHTFSKMGFFLPIFGVSFALSSFSKSSPIYKISKDDEPLVVLFAILLFLLPLYAHLHEIQKIEIVPSIWILAQISSICLGICTGVIFFRCLRKNHRSLGFAIIIGLLATSVGGLFGASLFKLISFVISYT